MQQKKIILFIIILFIASSVWLFHVSDQALDPDLGKNWWAVYFSDPKSESLDFTLENHSDKTDFHWEVLAENKKIAKGDEKIEKSQSKNIQLENIVASGKVSIQISTRDETREIYKNLP